MSNRCSNPQNGQEVVWLEDVSGHRYVRELVDRSYSRNRQAHVAKPAGKVARSTYVINRRSLLAG